MNINPLSITHGAVGATRLDVAYDKALEGARTRIMDCGAPLPRP